MHQCKRTTWLRHSGDSAALVRQYPVSVITLASVSRVRVTFPTAASPGQRWRSFSPVTSVETNALRVSTQPLFYLKLMSIDGLAKWLIKQGSDISMQGAVIAFERQNLIALLLDNFLSDVLLAI